MINRIKNKFKKVEQYYLRYNPYYWRLQNFSNTLDFYLNRPVLNKIQKKILADLNTNGIAIFDYREILDESLLNELLQFYYKYEEAHKDLLNEKRQHSGEADENKTYIHTLREEFNILDFNHPLTKIALQKPLLDIINSYFGLYTNFRYYDLWHTFVSKKGPIRSQWWHRDPEDYLILKTFIYLNDIDSDAGPFIYARKSHPKGIYTTDPDWFKEENRSASRATDQEVKKVVPKSEWKEAVGKKGTVIIADTRGLHKGGYAKSKERIMYNCMFVSPSSYFEPTFERGSQKIPFKEKKFSKLFNNEFR